MSVVHSASCPYDGIHWACTCGAGAPPSAAPVARLVAAARAVYFGEHEVAMSSYRLYWQDGKPQNPPLWNDEVWLAADPDGGAAMIELREALKAFP